MLGSATEDAVIRGFIKPGDSESAQAVADKIYDMRVKKLSSKRTKGTRAASHTSLKSPMALAIAETGQSESPSRSHSRVPSKAQSLTQLALLPPESQGLALAIPGSRSPSKSHHSLPLSILSSPSHSNRSHTGSLLESALAIPFQTPPAEQAVRYQNQLMATRPWLQAMVGKKEAGTSEGVLRTRSLPAVQGAAPNSPQAPKKLRKKSKSRNGKQQVEKSGLSKKLETVGTEDDDYWEDIGFGSMWLDFAEDEKNVIETKDPKQAHDILVPESVKKLDYWQALERFTTHDNKKNGFLDRDQFWALLESVCRGKEVITKKRAYDIYDDIDIDESGTMEKDEFMGWAFQTHNNYLAAVRKRLETMEPQKVNELFVKIDTNANGLIDKDEFWVFVDKFSPNEMTRQASDELHAFIDADDSGEISLNEFLNWVHPGRELKMLMAERQSVYEATKKHISLHKSMLPTGLSALGSKADDEDSFIRPDRPMMESAPGKPVVLEFLVGKEFVSSVKAIKKALRNVFGPEQIKFDFLEDPLSIDGCTRVTAKVGRGIVLWERYRMIQHREDPFENVKTAEMWIKDVLAECLPDVVCAANLRFQKRIRSNKCWVCSKPLRGLTPIIIEGAPMCSNECKFTFRKELVGAHAIEAQVQREMSRAQRNT